MASHATIFVKGTCTEDVTVGKDDLTLAAHEDGGTVAGLIGVVGAQRVTIDGLKVTGSGGVVIARDNASLIIKNAVIESAGNTAVVATRSASVVMENIQDKNEFRRRQCGREGGLFLQSDQSRS